MDFLFLARKVFALDHDRIYKPFFEIIEPSPLRDGTHKQKEAYYHLQKPLALFYSHV